MERVSGFFVISMVAIAVSIAFGQCWSFITPPELIILYDSSSEQATEDNDMDSHIKSTEDARVFGQATYADGRPPAHGSVSYQPEGSPMGAARSLNPDGSFELFLSEGGYAIGITPWDTEPEEYIIHFSSGEEVGPLLFVILEETTDEGVIMGRVTYEDGSPGGGLIVEATGDGRETEMTDRSGYYSMTVGVGTWRVLCDVDGFASEPRYHSVEVSSGDTIADIDFVLSEASPEPHIIVEILDESGYPLRGIEVVVEGEESDFLFSDETDAEGITRIEVEGTEHYIVTPHSDIHLFTPEFARVFVTEVERIEFLATEIDTTEYSLHFTSSNSAGSSYPGLDLRWRLMGYPDWNDVSTDISGYASVIVPEAGEYEVEAIEPEHHSVTPIRVTTTLSPDRSTDTLDFLVVSDNVKEAIIKPTELVFDVFPNPFNSALHINAPSDATIYDVIGNEIAKVKAGQSIWTPHINLESGVYYIKLNDSNDLRRVIYIK